MTSLEKSATQAKSKFVGFLLNLLLIFAFTALGRTQSIEIVYDFEHSGVNPQAAVIEGSDGFLYGTTSEGQVGNAGTVFKVAKDGSGFTLLKSFHCGTTEGCNPQAPVIEGSDGILYGTTSGGGAGNAGTVFKIGKDGSSFTLLKSFHCGTTEGCAPLAPVIEGSDGFLYGTTAGGGAAGQGTVFKIAKDGSGFTLLNSSSCIDSCGRAAAVIEGSDGFLYGTNSGMAGSARGTIFKVAKDGSGFTLLKSFQCATEGCQPVAAVIEGSDGSLYGTTLGGGAAGQGTVFKIAKDGSGFTLLKSFQCATDGCQPLAAVIEGSDGSLYGTTLGGGAAGQGTVFKIAKDGSGLTLLKSFQCATDGCQPRAPVIEGSDGFLYGTTSGGGAANSGAVFKIAKDGSGFALIKSLGCTDGCYPVAAVIEGNDGFLYGTTQQGGATHDAGTVFKVAKDGSGFTLLKSFQCATEGCQPQAAVIEGSDGFLYGTTVGGAGAVFKIGKDGSGFTLLKSFGCNTTASCSPLAPVIEGSDGFLYGTTWDGALGHPGAVFKIAKDGSGFTLLKSFQCTDGCKPQAAVIEGSDGFLYGTTGEGGAANSGAVFKIAKNGSGFTLLKSFQCATEGCNPHAAVIEGGDGFLYGTTLSGGAANEGAVFKIARDGTGFTLLKSFQCATEGCRPQAPVIEGSDGFLYGTTAGGGAAGQGTVFKIAKDGTNFILLHSFACDDDDGCNPYAGLLQASNGYLYGTTSGGGELGGGGTIFRIAIAKLTQVITVTQGAPASAIFGTSSNVAATGGGSGNPVVITTSGACSGSGNNSAIITMTSGTGTCTVTFNQAGNASYDPAPQVTQTTAAQKATPTISINNIPSGAVNGGSFTPTFAYTGNGAISVTSSTMSRCTVSGGVVNFLGGGTCTLTTQAAATANFNATTGSPQSFTINPASATISINNMPSSAMYGGSFKPTYAYIGNGKTSATSNTPSICSVANNGVVSFIGIGTCTLTANATATADYLTATGSPQSFAIGKATTTISIKNIPSNAKKGSSFTPTYNYTGDGTTSTTSSTPGTCTVSGTVVTFSNSNSGTCTLTAHATAGVNYQAVDGSAQSFMIK